MDDVQAAVAKVEAEIEALGAQLNEVVQDIKAARARQDEPEVAQLRRMEEQLRTEKEQLRTEKLLLLKRHLGASGRSADFRGPLYFYLLRVLVVNSACFNRHPSAAGSDL
jgi:septal ring factor EnvC (AmiA/AmiB activator)